MIKIPLILNDERSKLIWANVERTAKRVTNWPSWKRGGNQLFCVNLTCCGRDDGKFGPTTWIEADRFREEYISVLDHNRSAIITTCYR